MSEKDKSIALFVFVLVVIGLVIIIILSNYQFETKRIEMEKMRLNYEVQWKTDLIEMIQTLKKCDE